MTNEEMIVQAKNGDREMYEYFFKKNEKLALHCARKFENNRIELEELAAIAKLGMVKAYRTFDVEKGFLFVTYAYRIMTNEICIFLRTEKKRKGIVSLHETAYQDEKGNGITFEDLLVDTELPDIDTGLVRELLVKITNGFLETLTERERDVFISSVVKEESQRVIASRWNISQSLVSRIERNIIQRYRNHAANVGDFVA